MSRCRARKHRSQERCPNEAVAGGVCEDHGARAPQVVRKAELVRLSRDLDGYVGQGIPDTDPEANPVTALYMEHKRTVSKIRWIEHRLAETMSADDLDWGLSREEVVSATEFPGVNRTYEGRVPVLVTMLERERAHLVRVNEAMSRTQFRAAELAIKQQSQQQTLEYTRLLLERIVRAMGRDPNSPKVKARLAKVFAEPPEVTR